jgi:3',5'-cyclic AMP phosphodiesterase CpdA
VDTSPAQAVPGLAAGTVRRVAHARVVVVSDTHLSPAAPEALANWDAVLRFVDDIQPDAVIHLGDVSLDGTHDAEDLVAARRRLDRLPAPWHAIPGNHDLGDNPWPGLPSSGQIDESLRQRWLDIMGPERWETAIGGRTVLAVDAQLFGSGLDAEDAQWEWLEARAVAIAPGAPVVVCSHKPLLGGGAEERSAAPPYRFVPEAAAARLDELLAHTRVELVLSGHVHQHRELHHRGVAHVWVPTSWAVLPDSAQPVFGQKLCGVVVVELDGDGCCHTAFVEPHGITQFTLGENLANPYGH